MKLSVHLVTWNGAKYIPYLFESLKKQTFKDWQLFILDNGSTDSTIADCRLQIDEFSIEAKIIESKENLGFAGGHNRLFQRTMNNEQQPSDFVLLLNQDMYLEKDCLEKLVGFMSKNEEVAVVSPRLMYWDFEKCKIDTHRASLCGENAKCKIENSLTSKIDSLGLRVFRNRRVIEKYAGKEWSEIKSMMEMSFRTEGRAKEVFGVSGTLPMFRCSVIEEVGLFDLSYGSYKEDVDLAFRLRSAGHKAFVLLNAVSHHDRTGIDIGPVKNKKNQPEYIKYNSYKNHLMTLYKNEYWQNLLLDLPWILWYELRKFSYFLLFDRKVLVGLRDIWRIRKELKIKRLKIKKLRKISWREMRKWWL